MPLTRDGPTRALAVVGDDQLDAAVVAVDGDLDGSGVGMLDHVAQSLLRRTVEHSLRSLREAHCGIGLQTAPNPARAQRRENVRQRSREPLAMQAGRVEVDE